MHHTCEKHFATSSLSLLSHIECSSSFYTLLCHRYYAFIRSNWVRSAFLSLKVCQRKMVLPLTWVQWRVCQFRECSNSICLAYIWTFQRLNAINGTDRINYWTNTYSQGYAFCLEIRKKTNKTSTFTTLSYVVEYNSSKFGVEITDECSCFGCCSSSVVAQYFLIKQVHSSYRLSY